MKKSKLIKHLKENDVHLLREGSKHSVYLNSQNGKISTVPRYNEIKKFTVQKICKDLEIEILQCD